MISIPGLLGQIFSIALALVLAPLLAGWVGMCRAWLQSRSAPPLLQPYYMLRKLFNKDVVLADGASSLFRVAPFVVFGCMVLACAIIPSLSTDLPLAPAADALALVGVFGLARVFISLAAMDIGTSFGTLGGRREMLIGFLAEPALLMVIFTVAMIVQFDFHHHHCRYPGPSRTRHPPQPRLRRYRLHLRLACRECPRARG